MRLSRTGSRCLCLMWTLSPPLSCQSSTANVVSLGPHITLGKSRLPGWGFWERTARTSDNSLIQRRATLLPWLETQSTCKAPSAAMGDRSTASTVCCVSASSHTAGLCFGQWTHTHLCLIARRLHSWKSQKYALVMLGSIKRRLWVAYYATDQRA